MDKIVIIKEKIQSLDPRLKRHVYHDSRSRLFSFDTKGRSIVSVTHTRFINILDQGQVGACTGFAGIGTLGSNPLYKTSSTNNIYPLTQSGALKLYSDAQVIDGRGPYPPNDNGSYGLSIAKALQNAGLISGYQHTFSLNNALLALTTNPILVGINWYQGMFKPDPDGRVRITGLLAGGHQVMARQIDAPKSRIWFDNSWGPNWGVRGRFYLTFTDFGTLLNQQGDVIVLLPKTGPTPTPTPTPVVDNDATLALAMKEWLKSKNL